MRDLLDSFRPMFVRLRSELQRFRPGRPYEQKPAKATKRPHSLRKAERRRKNKVARASRRRNRPPKRRKK